MDGVLDLSHGKLESPNLHEEYDVRQSFFLKIILVSVGHV